MSASGFAGRMSSAVIHLSTSSSAVRRGSRRAQPRRACSASTMLSRTVRSPMRPSPLRSSEQKAMRSAMAVSGLRSFTGRPSISTVPESARSAPNSSRASSVRPDPSKPGEADHLPGVHGRGRPERSPRCGRRRRRPGRGVSARSTSSLPASRSRSVQDGQLVADHLGHHLQPRQRRDLVLADQPAVAQDRRAVGDLVDLLEEVRDEQHRHPGVAQVADHPEQLAHLAGVEAGGGLVEDEHRGVEVDGPGDGHQLLDRQRVVAEHRVGVDGQVEPGQQLDRPAAHGARCRSARTGAARGRAGCSPRP